ncbi:MAG: hypothetical protein M0D55_05495 [Elusimicrobiota bacterium]|nr:MAG: hypothetical protein M0D55_05495 [Elusimicrobiota bacterium]
MRAALLAVVLCGPAAAQTGLPGYDKPADPAAAAPPAASTETVSASTATAPADDSSGRGFKVGGDAPKPKLARPMRAVIHKDARDWEPLSLREGGIPGAGENVAALRVVKVKGRLKGRTRRRAPSPPRAAAARTAAGS